MGLVLGPVLGSLIFSFVGYMFTFIIFAAILFVGVILMTTLLPKQLNSKQDVTNTDSKSESEKENKPVAYSQLLFNFRALTTLIGCALVSIFANFQDSILAV